MFFTDPLAQFDLFYLFKFFKIGSFFLLYVNNLIIIISMVIILFWVYLYLFLEDVRIVPTRLQRYFELIYLFIIDLVYKQIGKIGLKFISFFLFLFLLLLCLNIIGLIPFGFAVTSHFVFSFYLSLGICLGIFIIGYLIYSLNYLKIFLLDIPFLLYPLMIIIELASYVIRAFSLAIRLSANIMSGHILVDIIAEVIVFLNFLFIDLSFFLLFIFFFLFLLESGVACLQAYVFILLLTIYFQDTLNLGH